MSLEGEKKKEKKSKKKQNVQQGSTDINSPSRNKAIHLGFPRNNSTETTPQMTYFGSLVGS